LSDFLDGPAAYHLVAHDVDAENRKNAGIKPFVAKLADFQISSVPVHHGPIPALAWRVDIAGRKIVFSGDMNNDYNNLVSLAGDADLLIAHNAVPEQATGVARNLHMPPSVIGQIAARARVKSLVLSHRMQRTLGNEQQTMQYIRKSYKGPLHFADDLQCFRQ
jgi:ribonuclease BN (tRNA processing enzyme)